MGVTNAATSVTALALDSRFDLGQAWIVAGIAGVDPQDASLSGLHGQSGLLMQTLPKKLIREIPEDWPLDISL